MILKNKGTTIEKYLEGMKITQEKADADLKEQARRQHCPRRGTGRNCPAGEDRNVGRARRPQKYYDRIIEVCGK